jgi:hypothetical protein
MWSSGTGRRRSGQNLAKPAVAAGWEWAKGGLEMSWARFEGSVGVETLPRARLAKTWLGGRGGLVLATKGARAGQQATQGLPVSPREGSRVVGCGGEAGGGGNRVGRIGGLGAHAGEGDRAIYSRERGCASPSLRREGFPTLMP